MERWIELRNSRFRNSALTVSRCSSAFDSTFMGLWVGEQMNAYNVVRLGDGCFVFLRNGAV